MCTSVDASFSEACRVLFRSPGQNDAAKIVRYVIWFTYRRITRSYSVRTGTGVNTMTRTLWSRKSFAFIAAMLILACVGVLARSKPFPNSGLSAEWQCSKTAGLLVTCTKNHA